MLTATRTTLNGNEINNMAKVVPVYNTKVYGTGEVELHTFLTLALGSMNGQFQSPVTFPKEGSSRYKNWSHGGPHSWSGRFGE